MNSLHRQFKIQHDMQNSKEKSVNCCLLSNDINCIPLFSKYKNWYIADEKIPPSRAISSYQSSVTKLMINTLFISGDLERLSRFWMSGMCKPNIQEKHASEPLSIAQFLSAFLLLGIGTVMSLIFIVMEHLYMRYMQNYVDRKNAEVGGCFSLVSQVLIYIYIYIYIYI